MSHKAERRPGSGDGWLAVTKHRNLELRLETFNLLNNFNWGNPIVNLTSGTFGRIQTQAGAPRILQCGVKFGS
jgi:hypothetical protein